MSCPERVGKTMLFLLVVLFFSCLPADDTIAASSVPLKVCVDEGSTRGTLSASSSLSIVDARGRELFPGKSLTIRQTGPKVLCAAGSTLSLPVTCRSKGPIKWEGKPYRGDLRIQRRSSGSGLSIVNVIPVEQYLRGVLKMEINPSWPLEAIKAQAIVARTYALSHRGRDSKKGYDFDNTCRSQVYRGINAEDPRLDRAIRSTRGLVVTWGGKLALTPYHADSGGWTADVRNVWGGQRPYLVSVREPFPIKSPYSQWTVSLSPSQVSRALSKMGYPVGTPHVIEVSRRDRGGRAVLLRISGSGGEAKVKANAFRMAIGSRALKSTFFHFGKDVSSPGIPSDPLSGIHADPGAHSGEAHASEELMLQLTQQGAFSTEEMMDMLLHPEKREQYLVRAMSRGDSKNPVQSPTAISSSTGLNRARFHGRSLQISGRGWGHGVGMSQWGAHRMAGKGWKVREILGHYYPGTNLTKMY